MRRWHHGHSLLTGLLFGLAIDTHSFVLITAGFTGGLIANRLWNAARTISNDLRMRLRGF